MVVKRFKLLVVILLVFLFCKSNEVYAEKLTCIYEGDAGSNVNDQAIMFVQDAEGNHHIYTNSKKKTPEIDDENWEKITANKKIEWKTNYYNEETNSLSSCPNYAYLEKNTTTSTYTLHLKDSRTLDFQDDKTLYDNNTIWLGVCRYETVTLYYNNDKFVLDSKETGISAHAGFTLDQLLERNSKMCPSRLYRNDHNSQSYYYGYVIYNLNDENGGFAKPLIIDESSFVGETLEEDEPIEEIDDCLDLFSQDFINQLNSLLLVVRIAVPILLIVLGILDFTKAIFSSSEEEMKKAQVKFMKRVMAGVVVFLIPTLVNLVLEIANSIWIYIDPNSCNIG